MSWCDAMRVDGLEVPLSELGVASVVPSAAAIVPLPRKAEMQEVIEAQLLHSVSIAGTRSSSALCCRRRCS